MHHRALILAVLCAGPSLATSTVVGQPPVRSALLEVTLPASARPERGFLIRTAARTTLDLRASDARVALSGEVEAFRLPLGDSTVTAPAIFAALRAQGLTLAAVGTDAALVVASRGAARWLVLHATERRNGWLYIGAATDVVARSAPAPTPARRPPRPPHLRRRRHRHRRPRPLRRVATGGPASSSRARRTATAGPPASSPITCA